MVIFLYDFIGWYTVCKSNLIVYQSILIVELKYAHLTIYIININLMLIFFPNNILTITTMTTTNVCYIMVHDFFKSFFI
jgi:hypothetical protein